MNTMEYSSSTKKLKLDFSETEQGSRMSDHLSALPDEILCCILSFVTVRDSVRTKLLSVKWRYLSDHRSVLHFDALSVLGIEMINLDSYKPYQSKFVRAVDQFLETWKGWNLSALKVQFCLGRKQASHIDRWIESGIRMEIEDLHLNFLLSTELDEMYVLSDQLLHSGEAFQLKRLRLKKCYLTFSPGCTSWISYLAILELSFVPLYEKDIECVLSGGLNLTSLSLEYCCNPLFSSINVELPSLKKLFLHDSFSEIELNCPNLEELECKGRVDDFKFSHVPLLTKVNLSLIFHHQGCSVTFDGLSRHAPKLQALSLLVMTEVQPPPPANNAMSCLKRLELKTDVPIGFDLFTITHLLKASPFLEILHLQLCERSYTRQSRRRQYSDIRHFRLEEVKIDGFRKRWNEMELAQYLLKNCVVLKRMVIVDLCNCSSSPDESTTRYCSSRRQEIVATLLPCIKTSAELVITTPLLSRLLDGRDRSNYGVYLSCQV